MAFADTCRTAVRSTDLVGRYGGEEFIMLLVGAGQSRAEQVTDTINTEVIRRARVNDLVLPTASYGIASVDPTLGLEQTIERADLALYRAKATGRNRTVHYTPDLAS